MQTIPRGEKLPFVDIEGATAREVGLQHGRILKARIKDTIELYSRTAFNGIPDEEIFARSRFFRDKIREFNAAYCEEIEAIAEGAELQPEWIYALNCRTELIPPPADDVGECSTICFPKTSIGPILAQNWDWLKPLEELVVLMRIQFKVKDKPDRSIMMMTEPGIIGKVGMNSSGVGVSLNLLVAKKVPKDGLPIHILLRTALDSNSVREWQDKIEALPSHFRGTTSAIVAEDETGHWVNYEFAGKEVRSVPLRENSLGCQWRTNHYLCHTELNDKSILASSYSRFERMEELVTSHEHSNEEDALSQVQRLLFDNAREDLPILRKFVWDQKMGVEIGTICALVMCLREKKLLATRGSPLHAPNFVSFSVL